MNNAIASTLTNRKVTIKAKLVPFGLTDRILSIKRMFRSKILWLPSHYQSIVYQSNVFTQPRIIPNLPIGIDESTEIDNEWTVVSFQSTKSQLRYSRHKSQSSNKCGNREEQSPSLQSRY